MFIQKMVIIILLTIICCVISISNKGLDSVKQSIKRWWNITKTQSRRTIVSVLCYLSTVVIVILAIYIITAQFDLLNKYLNVSYTTDIKSQITVTTISTTIFTTLLTVLLALIALAVTAYVFLNDSLSSREEYEQGVIYNLKTRMRLRLFAICTLSGLCIVMCLIIDNAALSDWPQLTITRYGVVLSSAIDIVFLVLFINSIVNYEKHLVEYAVSYIQLNQKRLVPKSKNCKSSDNNKENCSNNNVFDFIKKIGDIENLVNCIQSNHESEYGYHKGLTNGFMLKSIFIKKFNIFQKTVSISETSGFSEEDISQLYDHYRRLIEIRNCFWILQKSGDEIPVTSELLNSVIELENKLMKFAYQSERFVNLNFNDVAFCQGRFAYSSLRHSALVNIDFSNADLENCDFSESLIQSVIFSGAKCIGAVFSGARIVNPQINEKTVFENAVFRDAELVSESIGNKREGDIKEALTTENFSSNELSSNQYLYNFKRVSCQHANFVKTKFCGVNFENAVFLKASLADAILENCNFYLADFTGAIMSTVKISRDCYFEYANCSDIIGIYSEWGYSNADEDSFLCLSNSRFLHANLAYSKMERCDFAGSYMNDMTFLGTSISNCIFKRALLTNTDFSYALLEDCDFTSSLLSNSLLIGDNNELREKYENESTCIIRNICFDKAEMVNCSIRNQIFEKCSFNETALDSSVIRDTVFRECCFHNTQFDDVLLFNVTWINCDGNIEKSATRGMRFGTTKDKKNWKKSFSCF